ncbi:DASH complex subunit dam1 [Dispira parvispora]|uniref:DASH complex subunit dam1 n=1 Tax=Dispira parvispora TaxID=1520584 RepID=A0A9W8AUF1_9FUNG|nr:DASH complex subunit dam1 [Dispira parvispora]
MQTLNDCLEGPLDTLALKVADLHQHMQTLQSLNEQFAQFNAGFGTFILGIKANTQVTEFLEAPVPESYDLARPVTPPLPPPISPKQVNLESPEEEPQLTPAPTISRVNKKGPSQPNPTRGRTGPPKKSLNVVIRKIIDDLPVKFRDPPHRGYTEATLKCLFKTRDGLYLHELIREVGISKIRAVEYLNGLATAGHVVKLSRKGLLFMLNPQKYPKK